MSVDVQIQRIKANIADAYAQTEQKGAILPPRQDSENLADTIASIQTGLTGGSDEFHLNPLWWDIESILAEQGAGYRKKYIVLFPDSKLSTSVSFTPTNIMPAIVKTSDGAVYNYTGANPWNINHVWDTAKDKPCGGYSTRWLMACYDNSVDDATPISPRTTNDALYIVIDTMILTSVSFNGYKALLGIKLLNGANLNPALESVHYFFNDCSSLRAMPRLDFSHMTALNDMFPGTGSMNTVPEFDMNAFAGTSITPFPAAHSLIDANITNIKKTLVINQNVLLNLRSLLRIINNLADMTGQTACTLNIGSANMAKLVPNQIAVATAKNWNVV